MRSTPRILLFVILLGVAPSSLSAQRSWYIEEFHSDLAVQASGATEVTETIRFRFNGSWNGIFRDLLLTPPADYGRRDLLDVDLVSITDASGEPLRFETENNGRRSIRWKVYIPDAQDAARTVVIRYVVQDGIGFYNEPGDPEYLDELYWNVTGTEWEVPIQHVSARIILPAGVTPHQSAAYTGASRDESQSARIETDGNIVTFTEDRQLGPGENLTVATSWPGGFIVRTEPESAATRGAYAGWPLLLPVLAFWLAWKQWDRKGRDPTGRSIAPMYEPPTGMRPAELGTLIDHRAEMHDITSTLVDLAVRGFVHIEKKTKKVFGLFPTTDYVFHLKKPHSDWGGLESHETQYLNALFKYTGSASASSLLKAVFGGSEAPDFDSHGMPHADSTYGSVRLSDLKEKFYKDIPGIRKSIYDQLIRKGQYRTNPTTVKTIWTVIGIAVGAASFFAAMYSYENGLSFVDPRVLGAAGIASGIIIIVFGQFMPARTVNGARTYEHALGFKEFLSRVEEDRFRRMIKSPEQFEQYLPFAMAFKVEQRWAKAFEDMYREPPRWYSGYDGGHFHASSFTHDMSAMSTAASSTMSSSPSGSGGGGSSGGGGGGGGGGAF